MRLTATFTLALLAAAREDEPVPVTFAADARQIRVTDVDLPDGVQGPAEGASLVDHLTAIYQALGRSPGGAPTAEQVATLLKGDQAFVNALRGVPCHDGLDDLNGDGRVDVADCRQGAAVLPPDFTEQVTELLKADAQFVDATRGPKGDRGEPGAAGPGQPGSLCFEGLPDVDSDGAVDALDCAALAQVRV